MDGHIFADFDKIINFMYTNEFHRSGHNLIIK